jgi:hypothetical protein
VFLYNGINNNGGIKMINNLDISNAMTIKLDDVLPEYPVFKENVRRAPKRELTLNEREINLLLKMPSGTFLKIFMKNLLLNF